MQVKSSQQIALDRDKKKHTDTCVSETNENFGLKANMLDRDKFPCVWNNPSFIISWMKRAWLLQGVH